jgi:hypothetical protein
LFRYLLQFYLNFYQQRPDCSLTHFAPHLLKTFELFNYAFNVFVSIVSGKHGRHELFNMLFCRTVPTQTLRFNTNTKLVPLSTPQTVVLSKSQYQQKQNQKCLLPLINHHHRNNHYHFQY